MRSHGYKRWEGYSGNGWCYYYGSLAGPKPATVDGLDLHTYIEVGPLRAIPSRAHEKEGYVPFLRGPPADHAARGQDAARRVGESHHSLDPAAPP